MGLRAFIGMAAGLGLAATFAGCRHAAAPPDDGRSSFRFVTPPRASPRETGATLVQEKPRETVTPAEPILPLAVPVYPNIPRRARPPIATVGVRITIDPAGSVTDVRSSLLAFSTPGPHAAEFHEAVEAALAQWRFHPAEVHRVEPIKGPDRGDYLMVKGSEKIEWTFDLAFTFNASGDVLSGMPK